jgi:hypothetical protein
MGSLQAQDIQNYTSLDNALRWHLTGNHYPPIPTSMIPVCKAAIDAAQEYQYTEDPALLSQELELPEGVLFKGNRTSAPVSSIMEAHHLWDFVKSLEEIEDEEWGLFFEDEYFDEEE